jgi:ABC-type dipeptide/oligopeptide/nickel transport system permease component
VVLIVGFIALAIPRWARPDLYVGETGLAGTWHAMGRAFLHFDFGVACNWAGCPKVRDMWSRGYVADVSLLFGTIAFGVGGGFAAGLWCAARTGSRRARFLERAAALLYCAPVYALGFGFLLMFHATFGFIHVPYFVDAAPVWASPFTEPWDWFRTLLVPCLIAAAPLGAMCLRLVVAMLREQLESDHVRTAIAKGVPHKRTVRRHAGPYARMATASLVAVSAPIVVTNLILVERVFNVPGFFIHTWRASGHTDSFHKAAAIDWEMLVAISIWASVFVAAITFVMDFALQRLDPRVGSG